jgi:hypothetical protein
MVYKCTRQHFDLVSTDYYAQELKYQNVIDGGNNLTALNAKVIISNHGGSYDIQLPEIAGNNSKGEVFFYRPSNSSEDFRIPLSTNYIEVPKSKLLSGLYKVKVTWTANGKAYFDEQALVVK